MKDWKSIKVKGELMKDIEGIIEGSETSRIGFATAAIEKEIERIKKERYELDIQELVDEYRNNAVPYSKKGIKNLNDFASKLRTNTEDIKKSQSEISAMKRDLVKLKLQNNMDKEILERAIMGKVGLTIAEATELKKIVQEGRFDETLKQMKKDYELNLEKQVSEILSDPDKVKKILKRSRKQS